MSVPVFRLFLIIPPLTSPPPPPLYEPGPASGFSYKNGVFPACFGGQLLAANGDKAACPNAVWIKMNWEPPHPARLLIQLIRSSCAGLRYAAALSQDLKKRTSRLAGGRGTTAQIPVFNEFQVQLRELMRVLLWNILVCWEGKVIVSQQTGVNERRDTHKNPWRSTWEENDQTVSLLTAANAVLQALQIIVWILQPLIRETVQAPPLPEPHLGTITRPAWDGSL